MNSQVKPECLPTLPGPATNGCSQSRTMAVHIPRVALLIESSRTYGRGILGGIARYAHVHGPWSIYLQERELHSGIPEWLKSWKGDGIIARIEDRHMANALLRLGYPLVDVLGSKRFESIISLDTDAMAVAQLAVDFFCELVFANWLFAATGASHFRIDAKQLSQKCSRNVVLRRVFFHLNSLRVLLRIFRRSNSPASRRRRASRPGSENSRVRWRFSHATTCARNRCSTPAASTESRCRRKSPSSEWTTMTSCATCADLP